MAVTGGGVLLAPSADAAPAESTRALPYLDHTGSAVDAAGGSLVVGEDAFAASGRTGIRAYYRKPSGTWLTSVEVIPSTKYGGTLRDVAAAAGPSGVYVITWVTDGASGRTVHAAVRSSSGAISAPQDVFTEASDEGSPQLDLVTNDNGDAAVMLRDPQKVARYVRSTGKWTTYDVPAGAKRGSTLMLSASRTVDLTYATGSGAETSIEQRTLPSDANAFPTQARELPAESASQDLRFDIAMDAGGLQTLIVDPTDELNTRVYRETTRRGEFAEAFSRDIGGSTTHGAPHVASRGKYTRVTYEIDGEFRAEATRLYDGTKWGPERTSSLGQGSDERLARPLAIGTDGRGVQTMYGGINSDDGVKASDAEQQRALLETGSRVDQDVTINGVRPPALDVGRTSLSQLVITERAVVNFRTVLRTVVYVRR